MTASTWREENAPEIIGNSELLLDVLQVAQRIAPTDCTVLITGESGTGKDLLARAIHRASRRASGPFVALNCGAIPETLLESELFGHVRGAFTGAVSSRAGRFAVAEGGTIFLDEIGEMSEQLQAKILRVIQEKEFSPVGDSRTVKCNVRIVAATHRNLEQMVDEGKFRADLYWRLNVVELDLPALRERRDDIEAFCAHFIPMYNEKYGRAVQGVAPEALQKLCDYDWPGNIRQLENLIQRIVLITAHECIELEDLPEKLVGTPAGQSTVPGTLSSPQLPKDGIDLKDMLESLENALILQALERTSGNKNQAASLLRLNRTTLVEKLKKKGIGSICKPSLAA